MLILWLMIRALFSCSPNLWVYPEENLFKLFWCTENSRYMWITIIKFYCRHIGILRLRIFRHLILILPHQSSGKKSCHWLLGVTLPPSGWAHGWKHNLGLSLPWPRISGFQICLIKTRRSEFQLSDKGASTVHLMGKVNLNIRHGRENPPKFQCCREKHRELNVS